MKPWKFIESPTFMIWFHAVMTILFLVQIPFGQFTFLKESLPYIVFMSQWALVVGHWGAWQAAKAQKEAADNQNGGSNVDKSASDRS